MPPVVTGRPVTVLEEMVLVPAVDPTVVVSAVSEDEVCDCGGDQSIG